MQINFRFYVNLYLFILFLLCTFCTFDHFADANKMILTYVYTKATTPFGIVAYRNDCLDSYPNAFINSSTDS